MKILIDTNIVLDFLLGRDPFYENSFNLMAQINEGKVKAYITANSITDIVYVTRKTFSLDEIRRIVLSLLDNINVIGVYREDILAAFDLDFNDFEDALQSSCSQREQMDYIVTRNRKDFKASKVKAVDISDFLAAHCK